MTKISCSNIWNHTKINIKDVLVHICILYEAKQLFNDTLNYRYFTCKFVLQNKYLVTTFNKLTIMSETLHDNWKRLKITGFIQLLVDRRESSFDSFNRATQSCVMWQSVPVRYVRRKKRFFFLFCLTRMDNESQGVHVPCHEYCVNLYLSLDLNLWLLITVYL